MSKVLIYQFKLVITSQNENLKQAYQESNFMVNEKCLHYLPTLQKTM